VRSAIIDSVNATIEIQSFAIKTEVFEGPMDLLLDLVEKRKLLINDISLAEVTDEYMRHVATMQEASLPGTAQFVQMAATLLLIKSKSLLPVLELTEDEEETMSATVMVTVACGESFSVVPKEAQIEPGQCITFDALQGNTGCLLRLLGVSRPSVGRVLVDLTNNTFTYQAPTNLFSADVRFSYRVVDVHGTPESAEVTVKIATPIN